MTDAPTKLSVKSAKKTPVVKDDEWHPLYGLRHEIDRLFEDFLPAGWRRPFGRNPFALEKSWARQDEFRIAPAFDLVEKVTEYEITAELPGIDEKNIEIKLANGALTIRGEKSESKEEKDKEYYLSERSYGSFQRLFQMPENVETAKIEASFAKGVLTVKLPKSAEARQSEKTIAVKAAA